MEQPSAAPLRIDFEFLDKVQRESGIQASACYQCRKCSNGCPLTFAMDLYPDQIIRLLLLGQAAEALHSKTIWVCSSCETCTTRCPNEIDIAGLMDYLKQEACRQRIQDPAANPSLALHQSFLNQIRRRGRIHEGSLMNAYMLSSGSWKTKLKDGTWSDDLRMGWSLFKRGRMPIVPQGVADQHAIKRLFATSER